MERIVCEECMYYMLGCTSSPCAPPSSLKFGEQMSDKAGGEGVVLVDVLSAANWLTCSELVRPRRCVVLYCN